MSPRTFTLASRASQLAQIQTNIVVAGLEALYPPSDEAAPKFATSFMSTAGDRNQSQALYLLGGKALWTKDLEVALKDGAVDMLVHSFKDVPTVLPDGCMIGAILEREDPVDSLVVKAGKEWKSLNELPAGSVVGTSSVRRVAQLRRNYSGLKFLDVRGNLNTRMAKLDAEDGPYAALILAKSGMVRNGMGDRLTADILPPTLYHAVSQGALAVEIRSDDAEALELCKKLTHRETQLACLAERACLRVLEGGCSVPVGVKTRLGAGDELELTCCVTSLDGSQHVQHTLKEKIQSVEDAEAVGSKLAKILIDSGAGDILAEITKDRERRVAEAEAKEEVTEVRLAKELSEIKSEGCPVGEQPMILLNLLRLNLKFNLGINLVKADDFATWWFTIEVMGESLYKSEVYTLQFRFDAQYPISSPAVQFVVTDGRESPLHPHVYSNGHICASILGNEWSPVLSVIAVCVTLQSMLASCKVRSYIIQLLRKLPHQVTT
ncbi:porphobilinogen deaminase, dipyromethane cofactor binding domain-containing protein [Favolaschia claudopus]|uniref:Porphobilinogen deaminase n=1 Tax=Favolaschia claudopus TaxID=2862362 RepID=A0AAW0EJS9_9AGAR